MHPLLARRAAPAQVGQVDLQRQRLAAAGVQLPVGLAARHAQRADQQLLHAHLAFAAQIGPAAGGRCVAGGAALAGQPLGQHRVQPRHRCQRAQVFGVELGPQSVGLAIACRVAAALEHQPVAAQAQVGIQRAGTSTARNRRRLVAERHLGLQRHAGQYRFAEAQRAVAGHARQQRQRAELLRIGRQPRVELPPARQAVRPLAPSAARIAGKPRHGVEIDQRACRHQSPLAARLAFERGLALGRSAARGDARTLDHHALCVGLACEQQRHCLRPAFESAPEFKLGVDAPRRQGGRGGGVRRAQAGHRHRQRARQRHGCGAAVEPVRAEVVELAVDDQPVRSPQGLAAHGAGSARGVRELDFEARYFDAVALGQAAGDLQLGAGDRQPAFVPAARQGVGQLHRRRQRLVGAVGDGFGRARQPRLRRGRVQRGKVQLFGAGIERAQRPGLFGPHFGAQVDRRRQQAGLGYAAQRGVERESRQRPRSAHHRGPAHGAVARRHRCVGCRYGEPCLQRQRRGVADLRRTFERIALPACAQCSHRMRSAGAVVERDAAERDVVQRVELVDDELSHPRFFQLQLDRQGQAAGQLERRGGWRAAGPGRLAHRHALRVQPEPGRRDRLPRPAEAFGRHVFKQQRGLAAGPRELQPLSLPVSPEQRALDALGFDIRHAAQHPLRAGFGEQRPAHGENNAADQHHHQPQHDGQRQQQPGAGGPRPCARGGGCHGVGGRRGCGAGCVLVHRGVV